MSATVAPERAPKQTKRPRIWHRVDLDRPGYFVCGKERGTQRRGHWGVPPGEKCVVCLDLSGYEV